MEREREREREREGGGREGGKEMFYLTTHSTHFIYGYMASERDRQTELTERDRQRQRERGRD